MKLRFEFNWEQGSAGRTFWSLKMGMADAAPKSWKREWKIAFWIFGKGNGKLEYQFTRTGMKNYIPIFQDGKQKMHSYFSNREQDNRISWTEALLIDSAIQRYPVTRFSKFGKWKRSEKITPVHREREQKVCITGMVGNRNTENRNLSFVNACKSVSTFQNWPQCWRVYLESYCIPLVTRSTCGLECSTNHQLLNFALLFSDLVWVQYGGPRKPLSGL